MGIDDCRKAFEEHFSVERNEKGFYPETSERLMWLACKFGFEMASKPEREPGTLTEEERREAIEVMQAAIKTAPAERVVEEQQLRQTGDGPIEVVRERISFHATPETQATAALAALSGRFEVRVRGC